MSYSVRATTATVACCHARGEELDGHLLKKMERTNDKRWTDGSIIYCINVFFGFDFRVVSCEMSCCCCCCTVAWLVLLSVMPIFGFRLPCCGGFGVCSAQRNSQSHRQHNTSRESSLRKWRWRLWMESTTDQEQEDIWFYRKFQRTPESGLDLVPNHRRNFQYLI